MNETKPMNVRRKTCSGLRRRWFPVLLGAFVCTVGQTRADLDWRVSVKFILDANGHRAVDGEFCTDDHVYERFDQANRILASYGRGYRFKVVEILDVPGVSQWFDMPVESSTAVGLKSAVDLVPGVYRWNERAMNIYVLGSDTSGETRSGLIIVGQKHANTNTVFHECGHHLNLRHTFNTQVDCHSDDDDEADCGCSSFFPGEDEVSDTLFDHRCFKTKNQIARANGLGASYDDLNLAEKTRVDMVFTNLMCYRETRAGLTPGQLDRMTDASNGFRSNVASGRTWFVDQATPCALQDGSPSCDGADLFGPFDTLKKGVDAASAGDIVMVAAGSYRTVTMFTKSLTVRSWRGTVEIRAP
jgi:hypothetical protein